MHIKQHALSCDLIHSVPTINSLTEHRALQYLCSEEVPHYETERIDIRRARQSSSFQQFRGHVRHGTIRPRHNVGKCIMCQDATQPKVCQLQDPKVVVLHYSTIHAAQTAVTSPALVCIELILRTTLYRLVEQPDKRGFEGTVPRPQFTAEAKDNKSALRTVHPQMLHLSGMSCLPMNHPTQPPCREVPRLDSKRRQHVLPEASSASRLESAAWQASGAAQTLVLCGGR